MKPRRSPYSPTMPNKTLVPTAVAALSANLSVTITLHPVFTFTPAPAVGTAWTFAEKMKTISCLLFVLMALASVGHAGDDTPPPNMIEHARWARETKDLTLRIERLEAFLKGFIPLEEGAKIEEEYEDGSSVLAVTGSAWVLVRAYVEAGQKNKALKVIDWLQEHDSKSDLSPKKSDSEQAASGNGGLPR